MNSVIRDLEVDIRKELIQESSDIRCEFIKYFEDDVTAFIENVTKAYLSWQELEAMIKNDMRKAYVGALAFTGINLHIVSFKLFLSGYAVAAGNLQRQMIEAMSLLILCSKATLDVLDRYISDKYSQSKSLRDLKKHRKNLGINKDAVMALEKGHKFYHKYSHPSPMTIAEQIRFSDQSLFLGAAFDPDKIEEYKKEAKGKVSIARILGNVIQGAAGNMAEWEDS